MKNYSHHSMRVYQRQADYRFARRHALLLVAVIIGGLAIKAMLIGAE